MVGESVSVFDTGTTKGKLSNILSNKQVWITKVFMHQTCKNFSKITPHYKLQYFWHFHKKKRGDQCAVKATYDDLEAYHSMTVIFFFLSKSVSHVDSIFIIYLFLEFFGCFLIKCNATHNVAHHWNSHLKLQQKFLLETTKHSIR